MVIGKFRYQMTFDYLYFPEGKNKAVNMFEGAVAGILNRLLGKYVQDLDTENLNVGIFSGNVNLTDLKLKPEALVRYLFIMIKIHVTIKIKLKKRDNNSETVF